MKTWLSLAMFTFCILVGVNFMPVHALDLNAELSSRGIPAKPTFKFLETVLVDYHNGGRVRDSLYGKNMTILFQANSSNPSVQDLIAQINANLLPDLKSPVRVTEMSVDYKASVMGGVNSATVDYSLTLRPTITNYVMSNAYDQTILDAGWMGISLDGPIVIKTEKYGDVDINRPAGFLNKAIPDFYSQIKGTAAQDIFNYDLIDSSLVGQPIGNWQHMFDPAYIITETNPWGYKGIKTPITTFALGQTSIWNSQNSLIRTADITLDKSYEIQAIQHASSATIQIDGYAELESLGGQLAFVTTPQSIVNPSLGLSTLMIYAMAGFAAVIAGGIFWWSNLKMKQIVTSIETRPVEYEIRQHWADKFDVNQDKLREIKPRRSAI